MSFSTCGRDGGFAGRIEVDGLNGGLEMDATAVAGDDLGKGVRDVLVTAADVALLLTFAFALLAIEAGPEPQRRHVVVAVAKLRLEHGLPKLREGVFAAQFGEPAHGGDIVEAFVAYQTADEAGDADADAIKETQRGEFEQVCGGVEREELPGMGIREGGGPPVNLIADAECLQRAQQRSIAGQHAVIKFLKHPPVMLEEGSETSQLLRSLIHRDRVTGLRQTQRTGEPGNASAEDGDVFWSGLHAMKGECL